MFIFDGVNKTITIDNSSVVDGTVVFTPEDLWTAYVDWSSQADNLKYYASPALEVIGGNDIGGGEAVGNYLFVRNDLGWVGVPPSIDGVNVIVNGSLYGTDPALPIVRHISGQATNLIINRSVVSTLRTVSSGSGLSEDEHDRLYAVPTATDTANAVWTTQLPVVDQGTI